MVHEQRRNEMNRMLTELSVTVTMQGSEWQPKCSFGCGSGIGLHMPANCHGVIHPGLDMGWVRVGFHAVFNGKAWQILPSSFPSFLSFPLSLSPLPFKYLSSSVIGVELHNTKWYRVWSQFWIWILLFRLLTVWWWASYLTFLVT